MGMTFDTPKGYNEFPTIVMDLEKNVFKEDMYLVKKFLGGMPSICFYSGDQIYFQSDTKNEHSEHWGVMYYGTTEWEAYVVCDVTDPIFGRKKRIKFEQTDYNFALFTRLYKVTATPKGDKFCWFVEALHDQEDEDKDSTIYVFQRVNK